MSNTANRIPETTKFEGPLADLPGKYTTGRCDCGGTRKVTAAPIRSEAIRCAVCGGKTGTSTRRLANCREVFIYTPAEVKRGRVLLRRADVLQVELLRADGWLLGAELTAGVTIHAGSRRFEIVSIDETDGAWVRTTERVSGPGVAPAQPKRGHWHSKRYYSTRPKPEFSSALGARKRAFELAALEV